MTISHSTYNHLCFYCKGPGKTEYYILQYILSISITIMGGCKLGKHGVGPGWRNIIENIAIFQHLSCPPWEWRQGKMAVMSVWSISACRPTNGPDCWWFSSKEWIQTEDIEHWNQYLIMEYFWDVRAVLVICTIPTFRACARRRRVFAHGACWSLLSGLSDAAASRTQRWDYLRPQLTSTKRYVSFVIDGMSDWF